MTLTERQQSSSDQAQQRFAEATRSTAFNLNLGIMEIRLLRDNNFQLVHRRSASELAALQRLVDKGMVLTEPGKKPTLSEAGRVTRELLVLSRHITTDENPQRLEPDDLLQILRNGMRHYLGGGNAWLARVYLRKGNPGEESELRIVTKKTDYDVYPVDAGLRPWIHQEFAIPASAIREVTRSPEPPTQPHNTDG